MPIEISAKNRSGLTVRQAEDPAVRPALPVLVRKHECEDDILRVATDVVLKPRQHLLQRVRYGEAHVLEVLWVFAAM